MSTTYISKESRLVAPLREAYIENPLRVLVIDYQERSHALLAPEGRQPIAQGVSPGKGGRQALQPWKGDRIRISNDVLPPFQGLAP